MSERTTVIERFWEKVARRGPDDCWEWQACRNASGYGQLALSAPSSRHIGAHRFSALLHFGPFHSRLFVCHHCDNRVCVNPAHLYLGTPKQNAEDMSNRARTANQRKVTCNQGHPLSGDNLSTTAIGERRCRTCQRAYDVAYRRRKRNGS
jgi:hypothetical protein